MVNWLKGGRERVQTLGKVGPCIQLNRAYSVSFVGVTNNPSQFTRYPDGNSSNNHQFHWNILIKYTRRGRASSSPSAATGRIGDSSKDVQISSSKNTCMGMSIISSGRTDSHNTHSSIQHSTPRPRSSPPPIRWATTLRAIANAGGAYGAHTPCTSFQAASPSLRKWPNTVLWMDG